MSVRWLLDRLQDAQSIQWLLSSLFVIIPILSGATSLILGRLADIGWEISLFFAIQLSLLVYIAILARTSFSKSRIIEHHGSQTEDIYREITNTFLGRPLTVSEFETLYKLVNDVTESAIKEIRSDLSRVSGSFEDNGYLIGSSHEFPAAEFSVLARYRDRVPSKLAIHLTIQALSHYTLLFKVWDRRLTREKSITRPEKAAKIRDNHTTLMRLVREITSQAAWNEFRSELHYSRWTVLDV